MGHIFHGDVSHNQRVFVKSTSRLSFSQRKHTPSGTENMASARPKSPFCWMIFPFHDQEISQPWLMTPEGKLNVSYIYIYIIIYIIYPQYISPLNIIYPIESPWNRHCCWLNPKFLCDAKTSTASSHARLPRTEFRHPGAQVSPWGGVKPGFWTWRDHLGPPEFS